MPIIRSPSNCRCSLWFPYECGGRSVFSRGRFVSNTNRPRLRTLPPPHSYENQRLQRQFDGLLMMGIVMPEACWAVSVRQGNKFYDWLLHLVVCFIRVILLDPYSLRLIVILNLEILGCVPRFRNNVIIVCRKLPVDWYVGIVPTLLGTRCLHVDLDCGEGSLCTLRHVLTKTRVIMAAWKSQISLMRRKLSLNIKYGAATSENLFVNSN
jgi:hypothetical protein